MPARRATAREWWIGAAVWYVPGKDGSGAALWLPQWQVLDAPGKEAPGRDRIADATVGARESLQGFTRLQPLPKGEDIKSVSPLCFNEV